ncbi:AraC family transcriptional regulator [Marinobacter sp. AL4B]|uniref:AraC family transcriptional regulator n=1 Tax=Marinobacter sp. AL4B TaxID=2871173 RepID=UPI001CAA5520|nr:AraC family transcriptional regulator [Marinobacter sp. AL4B]MBZ0334003.1 AraC family transcriptional regulator [Marinobacter sp. AL4B]
MRATKSGIHNSPYVLNSFLNQFPQLVVSRGGDLKSLCARSGLSLQDVTGQNQLIPFDRFIHLLEEAATTLNAPDFALLLASRQDLRALGPVSLMLKNCDTVADAFLATTGHLNLLVSGIEISASESGSQFLVRIDVNLPGLRQRRQFQDYLVGSALMVLRQLHGTAFTLNGCHLLAAPAGPTNVAELSEYLGCEPRFGSHNILLYVPQAIMRSPLSPYAAPATPFAADVSSARQVVEKSIADALMYLFVESKPSIVQVASLLGYSERTLRRRLSELSLSYADILDAVRLEQANKYLKSTHYRISDIANLLGYANQSAFTRSYVRCTGLTPSEYRTGLRGRHRV